jgi:hypothetical protein
VLLRTIAVTVPAQEEIDADLSEYGVLSNKTKAAYGQAAVTAGVRDEDEPEIVATDAITNVLHHVVREAMLAGASLDEALTAAEAVAAGAVEHLRAEVIGDPA